MSYLLDCLPITRFFWKLVSLLPDCGGCSQGSWWELPRHTPPHSLPSGQLGGFGITGQGRLSRSGCPPGEGGEVWKCCSWPLGLHILESGESPSGGREQPEVGTQERERLGGQGLLWAHSPEMPTLEGVDVLRAVPGADARKLVGFTLGGRWHESDDWLRACSPKFPWFSKGTN